MPQVGIITDTTAQFPTPFFPGHDAVTVLPMRIQLRGKTYMEGDGISLDDLPPTARDGLHPKVLPPSQKSFREAIARLEHKYTDIIILLLSSQLNPATARAHKAIASFNSSSRLHIIDSHTSATGLGILVQTAARAVVEGYSCFEIIRLLRRTVAHTYTIFCLQSLTYLAHSGLLDPAQGFVGEMINLTPIFVLEYGQLRAIHKAHSARNVFDTFHEFTAEIRKLQHVTLLKGQPPFFNDVDTLRERIRGDFPDTVYSEYPIGASLATILGPVTLGMIVIESLSKDR